MRTLVTGGTGFLGAALVADLLVRGDRVVALVRGADDAAARERLLGALAAVDPAVPTGADVLDVVAGDVAAPGLGVRAGARDRLLDDVGAVVHSAASVRFDLPLDEARAINVGGTAEVLALLGRAPVTPRYVHVSTAFVGGLAEGPFGEDDLDLRAGFRNTYEQTKAEAEHLVRTSGVPAAIARPSIVVGEERSGWTSAFNVLYWPLQAYARGVLRSIPADPGGVVDAVPVDHVVDGLLALLDRPDELGGFALAAGPQAVALLDVARAAAAATGREAPSLAPVEEAAAMVEQAGDAAAVYFPYFAVRTRFSTDRGHALAGRVPPRLTDQIPALVAFAQRARWGKRPVTRAAARAAALEEVRAA